jgi:hypothetical protein
MNTSPVICGLLLTTLLAVPTHAQTDDTAAERAKLGNARIQAEAERQARAERERLEKEAALRQEADSVADGAQSATVTTPASDVPANRADMYRVLEQLRELGELKDAGYLTEDEFRELKQAIIGSTR